MGGKTGTTTSQVSIPPEVLQRYTSVNKLAEQTAQTPFQPYTGEFVAPLTATQQAGIAQTQAASQAAQPYFGAATQNLMGAQATAMPGVSQARETLAGAQQTGRGYADVAAQLYGQAGLAASPYYQAATRGTQAAVRGAQPYQQLATQFGLQGARGIQPGALDTSAYMNPYVQAVAAPTYQALMQQQSQEMQGQLANAIRSGAFGGDRSGIAAANLARQQKLGMAQAMAPIYQQAYQQALQTAQQQQGVGLSAEQANRAAQAAAAQQMAALGQQGYGQQLGAAQQMAGLGQALYGQGIGTGQAVAGLGSQQFGQGATTAQQQAALAQQLYGMGAGTAQQLAALGTGAQAAGLQGAQATIGAGTLEQQTKQAQDTAEYQQFLQQRGYPFQVAQFLANIAMGTGALSGSTTTTQQPIPFFSDRRLKDDVKEIGKTNDGMPIYSFKYKGDDATQIGLMAQDVEKKRPDAVGLAGGYKTVDYAKATEDSARPEKADGGLVPSSMGGSVYSSGAFARGGYAVGGDVVDPNDLQAIIQQQQQSFGPFGQGGLYGGSQHQTPFGNVGGIVPQTRLHVPRLQTASAPSSAPESTTSQAMDAFDSAMKMKNRYDQAREIFGKKPEEKTPDADSKSAKKEDGGFWDKIGQAIGLADGGIAPRSHYEIGGSIIDPYQQNPSDSAVPSDVLEKGDEATRKLMKADSPSSITRGPGNDIMDIAKFAMMFMRDGGVVPRHGYKLDGYVDDISPPSSYGTDQYDPEKDPFYAAPKPEAESVGVVPKLPAPRVIKDRNPIAEGVKPAAVNMPDQQDTLSRLWSKIERTESGGRQFDREGKPLISSAGAVGVGQILPSTGPEAAKLAGLPWDEVKFYNDENYNRSLGKAYFNSMYQKFGSPVLAAAAYNAGPGRVNDALKKSSLEGGDVMAYLPNETKNYVNSIFGNMGGIKPVSSQTEAPSSSEGLGAGFKAPSTYEGKEQPWSDFLTSKEFVVPFLSGLKGMAQSKSPFLGSAILEGLGTGAESYVGMQKQLADIAQTKALTGKTTAETARGNIYEVGGRLFVLAKDPQTGQWKPMRGYEYFKLPANQRPSVDASTLARLQKEAMEDEKAGGVSGAHTAQPSGVGSPTEKVDVNRAAVPSASILTDQEKDRLDTNAQRVYNEPDGGKNEPDFFTPQASVAKAMGDLQNQMSVLATSLSSLPRDSSLLSAGPLAPQMVGIANTLNQAANILGYEGTFISNPEDLGSAEAVNKAIANLSGIATTEAGQRAVSALAEMASRFPTLVNSTGGRADLLADIMVQQRREIDRNNYARAILERESNEHPDIASKQGRELYAMFDDRYKEPFWANDRKALKSMFNDKMKVGGKDVIGPNGRPMSVMEYLYKNGGNLSETQKDWFRNNYKNKDILRYFGI